MGGGGGKDEGGGTSVSSANPPWMDELGEWSSKGFKDWMGKQEALPEYPSGEMTNPYAGFQSLFGGTAGPDYLASFSEAPKQAYNQALTDTKNIFGARGLYGSVGSPLMSGAMASAGQNYSTAMADAQQRAQQSQLADITQAAKAPEWQNQQLLNAWNAQNAQTQQVIANYLAALGITVPAIVHGQVVEQDSGDSGKGGMGSLIGGVGSAAGAMMSDQNKKQNIEQAAPVLERLEKLDIKVFTYKPEHQESSGTEPTKHIGPMAQQWAELFGGNGLVIDYQDIAGVLLAAVKELAARVKQLEGGALCQE